MGAPEPRRVGEHAGRDLQGAAVEARPRADSELGRAGTHRAEPRSFRSAFAGQGNAILIPNEAHIREYKTVTLNTNVFCEERGARFGLNKREMIWWESERRICQVLQYEFPDRRRLLVGNLHATHQPKDFRLADAELRRAVNFVIKCSELEESLILAGDFNITADRSETIKELLNAPRESRWNAATTGIDNVLLRRAAATSARSGQTRNEPTSSGSSPIMRRSRSTWSCVRRTDVWPALGVRQAFSSTPMFPRTLPDTMIFSLSRPW